MEDFALSFVDNEVESDARSRPTSRYADEIMRELAPLSEPKKTHLEVGSAGYGADAITVIAILAGLFLRSKDINDALDAWPELGHKLKRAVEALRAKHGRVSMSEPAALLWAVELLKERDVATDQLQVLSAVTIPVVNRSLNQKYLRDFRFQPDRFYVLTFRDGAGDAWVVTLRSTGELESIQRLPAGNWQEYDLGEAFRRT